MSENEQPAITNRGFIRMPFIDLGVGERRVGVYESSAADEAKVWLSVVDDNGDAHAHMTLNQARQLAGQLAWLVANHRLAAICDPQRQP